MLFGVYNLNYGIDFKGGTLFEVQAKQGDASIGDIRSRLTKLNLGDIQVQEFGAPNDVLIRVEAQGQATTPNSPWWPRSVPNCRSDYTFRRVESVGPDDLGRTGARRNDRGPRVAGRDPDLHLVPVRMAVRAWARSSRRCTTSS